MTDTFVPENLSLPGVGGKPINSIQLRPYQVTAVHKVVAKLRTHRSTLLVMATGTGKTTTFSEIARIATQRVLVLAHRDELIDQAREDLEGFTGELVDMEQGNWRSNNARIVVGSIDSVKQQHRLDRLSDGGFGIIIIDEAHHATAAKYRKIIDSFPDAKILGVTATPNRADGQALGDIFKSEAFKYTINQAIADGWLCPIVCESVHVESISLANVRASGKDFNKADLVQAFALEQTLHGIVKPTIDKCGDRQTIIFLPGVENARRAAEICNRYKPDSARCIDSRMGLSRWKRKTLMQGFRDREFQYLFNVGVAVEGFNAPATSAICIARPARSDGFFTQMMGRGLRGGRLCPIEGKKDCLVLDFFGNAGAFRLSSAADSLGGRYPIEVRTLAGQKIREQGEKADPLEALRLAAEEFKATKEAAMIKEAEQRKLIVAKVDYTTKTVNPFELIKASDPRKYSRDTSGPPSTNVLNRLKIWKMDIPKQCTQKMGLNLIRKEKKRRDKGLAHYAQVRLLIGYGYDVRKVSKERASALIGRIEQNGWRSISRDIAVGILLDRRTGEEG